MFSLENKARGASVLQTCSLTLNIYKIQHTRISLCLFSMLLREMSQHKFTSAKASYIRRYVAPLNIHITEKITCVIARTE